MTTLMSGVTTPASATDASAATPEMPLSSTSLAPPSLVVVAPLPSSAVFPLLAAGLPDWPDAPVVGPLLGAPGLPLVVTAPEALPLPATPSAPLAPLDPVELWELSVPPQAT